MTPEEQKIWDEFLAKRDTRFAVEQSNKEHTMSGLEVRKELAKARPMKECYDFIGIDAHHFLGNISRNFEYTDISKELDNKRDIVEQMFHSSKETDDYYVGMWYTGFGYADVLFPKATSRPPTAKEVEICPEFSCAIGSQRPMKTVVKPKR